MATNPVEDLGAAIVDLLDILAECPTETGGNVWSQLVRHCKQGSVGQKFVKPVEQQIPKYIASLSEADKRNIWSQTEIGQVNGVDPSPWMIEDIELDLMNEFLEEALEQAFREAEE